MFRLMKAKTRGTKHKSMLSNRIKEKRKKEIVVKKKKERKKAYGVPRVAISTQGRAY